MDEVQSEAVSVVDGDRLVGIFSRRDLLTNVALRQLDPESTSVSDAMSRTFISADASVSYSVYLGILESSTYRYLAVFDDGKLRGVLSATEILLFAHQRKLRRQALVHSVSNQLN